MIVRQDLMEFLQQDAAARRTTMTDELTQILISHYAERMTAHKP